MGLQARPYQLSPRPPPRRQQPMQRSASDFSPAIQSRCLQIGFVCSSAPRGARRAPDAQVREGGSGRRGPRQHTLHYASQYPSAARLLPSARRPDVRPLRKRQKMVRLASQGERVAEHSGLPAGRQTGRPQSPAKTYSLVVKLAMLPHHQSMSSAPIEFNGNSELQERTPRGARQWKGILQEGQWGGLGEEPAAKSSAWCASRVKRGER